MVSIRKRAISPEQKALRRQQILDAAGEMFAREQYEDVKLSVLARHVGITKPALYRYFRGKEVLFLALYEQEIARIIEDFRNRAKPEELSRAMAEVYAERPLFCRLSAILHSVLERDLTYDEALEFKLKMKDIAADFLEVFSIWFEETDPEVLYPMLIHAQQAVIGAWLMAHPRGTMADVLARDDMAVFRVDFQTSLEQHLHRIFGR
ncbi:TetR family transcriptional regulator [Kordiimonas sp. SCSIO 12603]|uniref:TetR family transcriptional regulator n=1 Tax=Kordiimonas sp. SCSIO 12603 TaxID=2829596 RepID=UPI0021085F43|nr:TetR family transcriptional regulator [Kordiimonas sp. SCSIO 12603]UTW58061.1 TetR family transcriptional regulator [Kordiimonas sp. SCSIO 12603]